MKNLILLIVALLMASIAYAQDSNVNVYKPNELFDVSVHLTDEYGQVTGATCTSQIRYENFTIKEELTHNEISSGWYNATYNTSDVGTYLCNHNCTKGSDFISGNCNFIIKGDDKVPIAAIIAVMIVILVYLYTISHFTTEKLRELGLIKVALFAAVLWVLLLPINFAIESLGQNGATTSMIGMMSTMHVVMIYLNVAFTFYLIVFMAVSYFRSMNSNLEGG